jgi:hypothetical protein
MRNKYQTQTDNRETTPFESSEEAWFWYCLCEQLGHTRAHGGDSRIARPCESSDIIIAVKKLIQKGMIHPEHIHILQRYGIEQAPPHPHFGATQRICKLWNEAMHFLDTILRQKGIVRFF